MSNKFRIFLNNTHLEKLEFNHIDFLKNLKNTLNPFFWRKDEVFYDTDFIQNLCEEVNTLLELGEEKQYLISFEEILGDILSNANTIFFEENIQDFYFLWKLENIIAKENLEIDKNNMLVHLLFKQNENSEDKFILAFFPFFDETIFTEKSEITIIKDNYDKSKLPEIHQIPFVKDENSAFECVKKYRTPLNFHLNPKHGENGKGNQKGESVLYCNEEEASKMLQEAIMKNVNNLYPALNYDQNHKKFIVFKHEGDTKENLYHAFHLDTELGLKEQKFPDDLIQKLKEKFNLK